jgi:signal transduction histidine kinase
VVIRAATRAGAVCIDIEDTGPGIPAPYRDCLFEPYMRGPRSAEGGLGLGLATVKRLVEAHGGVVSFRTTEGEGTTFTVLLPIASASR